MRSWSFWREKISFEKAIWIGASDASVRQRFVSNGPYVPAFSPLSTLLSFSTTAESHHHRQLAARQEGGDFSLKWIQLRGNETKRCESSGVRISQLKNVHSSRTTRRPG